MASKDFQWSEEAEPHIQRTKDILKKYPQIKELIGKNPNTIYYTIAIVALQITIAYFMRDQAWWVILLGAFCIGAFANHALFVLVHEYTHNMVFKKRTANILGGILCDFPNCFPSSVSFRTYHLKHHAFQGDYDIDADIASYWEAKLIGSSFIGKVVWMNLFPLFQALRPRRLKEIKLFNKWTYVNLFAILIFDFALIYFWGPWAFLYLVLSFSFSVGFHPLGARWIQEHFLVAPPQETYSYYGPLNKLAFNVGYHNEHHDFSYVPWNNLPKIREIAPEYYNNLVYHTSWTKLWLHWLFDSNLSLYSRTLRKNRGGIKVSKTTESDYLKGMNDKEKLVTA